VDEALAAALAVAVARRDAREAKPLASRANDGLSPWVKAHRMKTLG
jgi:hypothetical protein